MQMSVLSHLPNPASCSEEQEWSLISFGKVLLQIMICRMRWNGALSELIFSSFSVVTVEPTSGILNDSGHHRACHYLHPSPRPTRPPTHDATAPGRPAPPQTPSPTQSQAIQPPILPPKFDEYSMIRRPSANSVRPYSARPSRCASRRACEAACEWYARTEPYSLRKPLTIRKERLTDSLLSTHAKFQVAVPWPSNRRPALSMAYLLCSRACDASPRLARA